MGAGQPSTRDLENGAADALTSDRSFEITGSFTESSHWTIDLQVARPNTEHIVVSGTESKLEAIILGKDSYFRGNQFLSQHLGDDPVSRGLVKAAGNAWWKGSAGLVSRLPDFTDGILFRSTFLGTAATRRTDHLEVGGLDAVDLSGPRADVFIAAGRPHRVLRVRLRSGAVVDGIREGDLRFDNFDQDFGIAAPGDVIDFSNLSTLPPVYSVVSLDTSGCGSPCTVSALLKNLGGVKGARAPSAVTFTMTDLASGQVLGSCRAAIKPDVGYNATTTVGCTIGDPNAERVSATSVTAVADNPGGA